MIRLTKFPHKYRRLIATLSVLVGLIIFVAINAENFDQEIMPESIASEYVDTGEDSGSLSSDQTKQNAGENASDSLRALTVLSRLEIKGRAPKTGYTRLQFYKSWPDVNGCGLRQRIIKREFGETAKLDEKCNVVGGGFIEPYTGKQMIFTTKAEISKSIQIDHVVALSDAWQKGAQNLDKESRFQFATDPLNLLAVDSSANMQKSDGDAATWLPKNNSFRCQYVARQISIKYKYHLWVSQAEYDAMRNVLVKCPNEPTVGISTR